MKYTILYYLAQLIKKAERKQLNSLAYEVRQLFDGILNEKDFDGYEDFFVNSVGLRGDTTPEHPGGGFTLEPIFFNPGDLDY